MQLTQDLSSVKTNIQALVTTYNDFQSIVKELTARDMKVVADVSTEPGQADFAADVIKVKGANADAVFVYLNEEESARFLREAKKQGLNKPLIGETTLLGQKVIELAGDAANGVKGHVGLTVDAPLPADNRRSFQTCLPKYHFNFHVRRTSFPKWHFDFHVRLASFPKCRFHFDVRLT